MSSLLFPDTGTRMVLTSSGRPAVNKVGTLYADADGTDLAEVYADADGVQGDLIADAEVTTDAYGQLPTFWGPADGTDRLYITVNGGPLVPVDADYNARIDAHTAATTAVHGITDTSVLETTDGAAAKAAAAQAAAIQRANHTGTQSADTIADGVTNKAYTATERTKLAGIAATATANATDAQLRDRSTHTGTQPTSSVTGLDDALGSKADLIGGLVPTAQIPALAINETFTVASEAAMLALSAERGDMAVRTDFTPNRVYLLASDSPAVLADWKEIAGAGSVITVNGQSGAVTLAAADVDAAPASRSIGTAAPLAGGGDLSANRTLSVANATTGAVGVVQLAGDLTGAATAPAIAAGAVTTPKIAAGVSGRLHIDATKEVLAGDSFYGTPGTRAAFINALDAAEAAGKGTIVRIPAGLTIDVVSTLSMSGRSCQILGAGAGLTGSTSNISVIKASAQAGPVINFAGYVMPANFRGKARPVAKVMVQGSGIADATKANSGLKFTAISSVLVHDVAIMGTGGPCLEMASNPGNAVYLSDFERIIMSAPVSAKANDVPWFYANECNGNRFRGFGFRSISATGDVGASGAVVIEGNASYAPHDNLFDAFWYEFLHPPTNGTLFHHAGNSSVFRDFQFFDCTMESGAAGGTSFFRFVAPTVNDIGGNILRGVIHGDNNTATYIDTGVDMRQSRNRIEGVRGYRGKNVTLASGVDYTYAHLGGSVSGVASSSASAFVINSTATHNVLVDEANGDEWRGGMWVRQGGALRVPVRTTSTASSATPTPSADTTDAYLLTALAANATFGAPTGTPADGQRLSIRVKDNGTARTLAWNAIYRAVGVTLPTTTVVGKTLYVTAVYNTADTKWDVVTVAQEA